MRIPVRGRDVAQALIVGVSGAFIAITIRNNWTELVTYPFSISAPHLLASILVLLFAAALVWIRWVFTVRLHGSDIGIRDAGVIYWLFQLSTYIPGGIWQYLGVAYLSHQRDISKRFTTLGTVHHQILGLTGAAITFAGFGGAAFLGTHQLPLVLLLIVGLTAVSAYPPLLETVFSFPLRLTGRAELSISHGYRTLFGLVLLATASWTLTGAGFYLLALAFEPITFTPLLIAILPGAWVVGFVLLLAPGGLGVREAALIALLGEVVAYPLPIILSLASRLWMLLPELMYGGLFLVLDSVKDTSS